MTGKGSERDANAQFGMDCDFQARAKLEGTKFFNGGTSRELIQRYAINAHRLFVGRITDASVQQKPFGHKVASPDIKTETGASA